MYVAGVLALLGMAEDACGWDTCAGALVRFGPLPLLGKQHEKLAHVLKNLLKQYSVLEHSYHRCHCQGSLSKFRGIGQFFPHAKPDAGRGQANQRSLRRCAPKAIAAKTTLSYPQRYLAVHLNSKRTNQRGASAS